MTTPIANRNRSGLMGPEHVRRLDALSSYATISTDAAATVSVATGRFIRHTGTLTADRTLTLSSTAARAGSALRITRTGIGAFNLSIGGLKNLATNTWAEVVFDGTAWYLAAYGAL